MKDDQENRVSNDPDTPADFSLKRRALCQTLSKALLMSQNMARTSLPSSRALQMYCKYQLTDLQ